jgi:SAM-dependent methyltransferase
MKKTPVQMQTLNAEDYERRYQEGYGLAYPESHIIRVNKQILEWELHLTSGRIFDFGCGTGAHLKYFADQGFVPYGCDTSPTAIKRCQELLPQYAGNFKVTPVNPDLISTFGGITFDIFLSNQVLYFMDDAVIRKVILQAFDMVQPGGVLIATMMAYSCWYARCIVGEEGDFKRVNLDTPRQKGELLINFKEREALPDLFAPFKHLHLGTYGSHIRQEEGSTDHWLFVGLRA